MRSVRSTLVQVFAWMAVLPLLLPALTVGGCCCQVASAATSAVPATTYSHADKSQHPMGPCACPNGCGCKADHAAPVALVSLPLDGSRRFESVTDEKLDATAAEPDTRVSTSHPVSTTAHAWLTAQEICASLCRFLL